MMALEPEEFALVRGDQVRIAVLGCGYWGPNHIRNFLALQHMGAVMSVAVDPNPARRRQVENQYPNVAVSADWQDAILNPDIDAVVVATPARMHFEHASRALAAGKHVLVEKPIATSFAEAVELARIAAENDRVLMVGHTFQYAEAVSHIRDVITSGELGDLSYIRSLRMNFGHLRTDVDVLWDLAPHDLSILLHTLERFPRTVQATANARVNRSVNDLANIELDFGDHLAAHITVSWLDPRKIREMTFVGDRKMLVYDNVVPSGKIRIFDRGIEASHDDESPMRAEYSYRYGDTRMPTINETEPLLVECQHFVDCCQLGKTPLSDAGSGAAVTAIIDAAQQSIRGGGRVVTLDMFDETVPFADWLGTARLGLPSVRGTTTDGIDGKETSGNDGINGIGGAAVGRFRALVIDPDESRRRFAASALATFEPGFEVVTVQDVEGASEWLESFCPDLLVVSAAIDSLAVDRLMDSIRNSARVGRCKVVLVGSNGNDESKLASWHDVALSEGAALAEWLSAVQYVLKPGGLDSHQLN